MSARPSRERIALKAAQQVLASIPFQAEVKARLAKKTSRQDPTVADFDTAFAAELSHLTGQVLPRLFAQPGAITLVDQYRNYLAKSWLLHALDLASDDSMSPSALARKCKDILLREVFMSTQWMRAVVPLINFETDRGFRITGRYNDKLYVIKVKKPTYYVDPTTEGFYPRPPRDDFDPFLRTIGGFHQWLGIIDVQYERSTESFALIGTHEHYDLRRCFLLAMRLFGEGSIDGPFAYHSSENVYHAGGYSVHSNRQSVGLGNTYKFNMSRILGFRRMWHRVLGWFPTDKLPDRIQIGLRYFESSYYKLGVDRFLDLGIGLEA